LVNLGLQTLPGVNFGNFTVTIISTKQPQTHLNFCFIGVYNSFYGTKKLNKKLGFL
jgi:hypothetical protein